MFGPKCQWFHSQLIVHSDDIQEVYQELEEGEIAAPASETQDSEELEDCGHKACEKPKKHKKASKSKKGKLRAQIQSDVGLPSTPKSSKQKHKAPAEEQ
jgi:hypothetical protein